MVGSSHMRPSKLKLRVLLLIVSDSLEPRGLQTSRLLCPWNFPGKNTGVGCNALLQGIFPTKGSNQHLLQVPHESEDAHSCPTLCNPMEPARLPCPWDFPGKNTGVGCHFLLQGIFLTQGSNSGLPHCRQTLYHLSHLGIPSFLHSREILYP